MSEQSLATEHALLKFSSRMLLCPTADTSGAATGSELQRSAAAGRYLLLDDAVPEPAEAHFHLHAARHLNYKVT